MKSVKCSSANAAGTVWVLRRGNEILINACYVDDILHFTNSPQLYREFRKAFQKEFDLKSSDHVDVYLGNEISIDKNKRKVVLSQSHYILSCLDRFGLLDSHGVDLPLKHYLSVADQPPTPLTSVGETYRAMVGSLLYIANWTRPDISFSVSELS